VLAALTQRTRAIKNQRTPAADLTAIKLTADGARRTTRSVRRLLIGDQARTAEPNEGLFCVKSLSGFSPGLVPDGSVSVRSGVVG
jgi:hypothetical protein